MTIHRCSTIVRVAAAALLFTARIASAEDPQTTSQPAGGSSAHTPRIEIGGQLTSVRSSEFDANDTGFGGRAAWFPASVFSVEGEVNVFPSGFPSGREFSGRRLEALFGVTAGPTLGRVRPFARFRPGLVQVGEASEPIACILIFPPPLSCTLAAGKTLAALDFGGGIQVSTPARTFFRVDLGDRAIRYPGQVFDDARTVRDQPFFSHDFRFSVGGGIQF